MNLPCRRSTFFCYWSRSYQLNWIGLATITPVITDWVSRLFFHICVLYLFLKVWLGSIEVKRMKKCGLIPADWQNLTKLVDKWREKNHNSCFSLWRYSHYLSTFCFWFWAQGATVLRFNFVNVATQKAFLRQNSPLELTRNKRILFSWENLRVLSIFSFCRLKVYVDSLTEFHRETN